MIAFKSLMTGQSQNPRRIFFDFLKNYMHRPDFIEDMFLAIAKDCGLNGGDTIKVNGVPGYKDPLTVGSIGKLYKELLSNWEGIPGNLNIPAAIMGDLENLYYAATHTYFRPGSHINVVIFGHTHVPIMGKTYYTNNDHSDGPAPSEIACRTIYANCGTWVDSAEKGCTYVETEDDPDKKRLYVRVMGYPGNNCIDEAFVEK